MNTVNLVVQYNEHPDNMHDQFVNIMNFYDGHEATINGNGEVESVRFYWYDIPKGDKLNAIVRKLASDGVKFKLLPPKFGNYDFDN